MKTTSRKQALTLAKILTAKTEKVFFMVRSGLLTRKTIEAIVEEYLDTLLASDQRERYGIAENDVERAAFAANQQFRNRNLLDPRKKYEMPEEASDGELVEVSGADNLAFYYRQLAARFKEQLRTQDHHEIVGLARILLGIWQIDAASDSPELSMLCDALLAKEVEANQVLAERADGNFQNEYDRQSRPEKRRRRLSALMDRYCRLHADQWKARGAQKPQEQFGKVLELLGDIYTDEITQDMLVGLFEKLSTYPKWRNHKHMKGLTLDECMAHPKYQPIHPTTFKGIWHALGGLLTFGAENGEYGVLRNFCADRVFLVKKKALETANDDQVGRLPYTRANIEALIIQLGKLNPERNPHLVWIPLIGLYSGMRQSEICQLFCDDIIKISDIPCIRIRSCAERKQNVKTVQSERVIPIHPTLLELGILDYVQSRRELGHERLWQGVRTNRVEYYQVLDSYSHYFEKWYNRTFRKMVLPDEEERRRKPFHALRHTFINWFFQNIRSNERDNAAVKGLVGHLESDEQRMIAALVKGITWEVYSQKLAPLPLLETLKLLDYGVDLTPLRLSLKKSER